MTAVTKLALWNIALTILKSRQIESVGSESSREAKILDLNWEGWLWKHFAEHPWKELTTYLALADSQKVTEMAGYVSLDTPHPQWEEYNLALSDNAQILGFKDNVASMGQGPSYQWEEYLGTVTTASTDEYVLFATNAPVGTFVHYVKVPLTDDQLALWKWPNAQVAMKDFAAFVASQFGNKDQRIQMLQRDAASSVNDRMTLDSMGSGVRRVKRDSNLVNARRTGYGAYWSSR